MQELGSRAIETKRFARAALICRTALLLISIWLPTPGLWAQSTCTWNQNGPGSWNTPGNWNGCSGGNGPVAGTPGSADHAIFPALTPNADVYVGFAARTVAQLTVAGGRLYGGGDLSVSNHLTWSGGQFDGDFKFSPQLIVLVGATATIDLGLHTLAARNLVNFGAITWSDGDIRLEADAEIENRGDFVINHGGGIRAPAATTLLLLSDGSLSTRFHNVATAGARLEKLGDGAAQFAANVVFDNGTDVVVSDGSLRLDGPGGDFGTYQIAAVGTLEFGMMSGDTRILTGTTAVTGAGTLRQLGSGELRVTGGFALTGQTEVVNGLLYMDTAANPLNLPFLRVRAPGIFDSPDQLVVSSALDWNGGRISGTEGSTLTLPSGASASVILDDAHTEAVLRLRTLINQGTVLVSATGSSPFSHRFTLDGADIDNQGDFELRSNNQNNLVLDCATSDCASFFNRSGATLRLNDVQGIVVVGSSLTALNNAGLVDLVSGCGQISPPGIDTGTYRYNSNCTLAFFTRAGFERVFESSLVLDQVGASFLQLEGRLRLNGATRALGNVFIQPAAQLYGPAAITFTDYASWRGVIEGSDVSETVTIAPAALVDTNDTEPLDTPTLRNRSLINNGTLNLHAHTLLLDGGAQISNSATLGLLGTPARGAGIGCLQPSCGTLTNTGSGAIFSAAVPTGPQNLLDAGLSFSNANLLDVGSGTLLLDAIFTTNPGSSIHVQGGASLRRMVDPLQLTNGTLSGAGSVQGDLNAAGIAIAPGDSGPGVLTVLGNFQAAPATVFSMQVAGATAPVPIAPGGSARPTGVNSYDRLTVSGMATLAGTLNVLDLAYVPAPTDQFDFIVYGNRIGNVLLGANPYSGFALQTSATRVRLTQSTTSVCEWNPDPMILPNDWTNPAKWINCSGGVGPGPGPVGTPGASDSVSIGGGMVNLNVPVTVAGLQLTGGTLSGANNLTVTAEFDWTGGSLVGPPGSLVTLNPTATVQLRGGQKTLDGRTLQLNGAGTWTTGLIELANAAVFSIGAAGTLTSNPNVAVERFFASGIGVPELRNFGALAKVGPNTSIVDQSVAYEGPGSVNVAAGSLIIGSPSSGGFNGSYTVNTGAFLAFVGADRSFGATVTLGGAGTLLFGDTGPVVSTNTVTGCFNSGVNVYLRSADLVVNCASPTRFNALRLEQPNSTIEGSSALSVSGSLGWSNGLIRGSAPSQTFILEAGATGVWDAPMPQQRILSGRRFDNHGAIAWVGANSTRLADGAVFTNASDGSITVTAPGGFCSWLTDLSPGVALINQGLIDLVDVYASLVDVPFANDGIYRVRRGSVFLTSSGVDSGIFDIAAGASLSVTQFPPLRPTAPARGPVSLIRTLTATGSITGTGEYVVADGSTAIIAGGLSIASAVAASGGILQIDSISPVSLSHLTIAGGTLTGNTAVDVKTSLDWFSGGIAGSGTSPGPLTLLAGAAMNVANDVVRTLDNRDIRIQGNADWSGGEIRVPSLQSGRLQVLAGGTLQLSGGPGSLIFGCAGLPCTAEVEIAGELRLVGPAGAQLNTSMPVTLIGGLLSVDNGTVTMLALIQNAGSTRVASGATLQVNTLDLNGGSLEGSGTVDGDVNNVGGTVRPGSSPGLLNLTGDYVQSPGGTLEIEVGGLTAGLNADFLSSAGAITLGGTLNVSGFGGYVLTAPNSYAFVSSSLGRSGGFATTNIAFPGYQIGYDSSGASLLPTVAPIVVNSTVDPGDGTCDAGECTLREALVQANVAPTADTINFAIPAPQCSGPGGACVITPSAPLPSITTSLRIDGYSQAGALANSHAPSLGLGSNASLRIELDGNLASGGTGLTINAPGAMVAIEGLSIYRFGTAIATQGPGDANYQIGGNFIGLRADGSAAPAGQLAGVSVQGGNVFVGDSTALGMNVISGNSQQGIVIQAIPLLANLVVRGNLIGTTPSGLAPLPNGQQGIIATTSTQIQGILIGGNVPDDRNVISGNVQDGIRFDCSAISGNCFDGARVFGNFIGPAANGSPLGNAGNGVNLSAMNGGRVDIGSTTRSEANVIAFNGGNGVLATFGGVGRAALQGNAIFANGQLAVDLGGDGRTANDAGDGDTGPNGLLNFPLISSYSLTGPGDGATIGVTLSTPDIGGNYPAHIDFYQALGDQPGVWLGSTTCLAPPTPCSAAFSFPGGVTLAPDEVVLAMVTDNFGKSSEASFYASTATIVSDAPDPSTVGTPYSVTVEVASSAPFTPQGPVDVSDGAGGTCPVMLLPVSPGLSSGSCMLSSIAPVGARTLTASFTPETPPRLPFSNSSDTEAHTVAAVPLPVISLISRSSGPVAGGTLVSITGSNFAIGATSVLFGANPASGVSCSSTTQCTATSPAGTGSVSVRATTLNGTSVDTRADDFTYSAPATLCTNVSSASNFPAGTQPRDLAIGDFNGDGKRDLVTVNSAASGDVSVLLGTGTGSFLAAVNYPVGPFPRAVAIGDFNGDGNSDLAVANYGATTVSILLGTGTGTFGAASTVAAGSGPHGVAVGDFNADGRADLAVVLLDVNSVGILLGNGDGTFGSRLNNPNLRSISIAVSDFDRDGRSDFAVGNQTTNAASAALGTGAGFFGAPSDFPVGSNPWDIVSADFNGDGISDLAVSNRGSNNLSVLLGTGTGAFSAATNFAAVSQPSGLDAGDFNGDGNVDLVVGNSGSANVSLLLGNGTGSFGGPTNFAVGNAPSSTVFGDFNGDNRPDIAVANEFANNVSVLLNLGCPPAVTMISPASGATTGGTVVTLTGTDFVVGATSVNFGASPATAVSCASTIQCTATSPAGSGVVDVIATTAAGSSANTAADDYTYACPLTVVSNSNDSGAGSLRQIIADACAGSVVTFAGGISSVNLTSAELVIAKNLSIDGGLGVTVARQAATPDFRIFNIGAGNTVVLDSLTISNGNVAGYGGGILSAGNLTVLDSVISGNNSSAGFSGGGIANDRGTLVVDNSTISGNSAAFYGGGIVQYDGGSATLTRSTLSGNTASFGGALMSQAQPTPATLDIRNCTISGNTASNDGPGIYVLAASAGTSTMTLRNSTIAGNGNSGAAIITRVISGTATSTLQNNVYSGNLGPNVTIQGSGVNTSLGNNVSDDVTGGGGPGDRISTDPLLAPLGNYGGPTQTHALLPGSPAINAANNAAAPLTDQRGIARPQQGTADIGAFESQGFVLSVVSGTPQSAAVNTAFALPLVVGVSATGAGEPVNGGLVLYTAPGAGASATFVNPATIAAGQASVNATANGILGSYSVTAAAAGATGTPSFALTNGVVATSTSISAIMPDPTVVGQPYTVTVAVTSSGAPIGAGTVEVRQLSDGAICTIALASATSCQLVANSALTTAVRAFYLGAPGFAASSSSTLTHLVNRADTSITITDDSPDPSGAGQPITVGIRLDVVAPGAGTPTGQILISDGTASCGITLPNLSCNFVPKALGAAILEARYEGDANFNLSTDTETHTISVDGADLAIIKRNGLRLLPGGLPSTYTLLVTNAGPQSVINARVSDILPAQLTNASWTCSASGGGVCPASGVGTVDALVNLPAGASVTFALTVTAQLNPEQLVSNRATVTAPANAPDPILSNNESIDVDVIGVFGEGFETESE